MAEFRPPERKLYFVINLYEHVRKPQKYQSFTDAVCHVMGRSQRHTQFEEGLLLKSTEPHAPYPYVSYSVFDISRQGRFVAEPDIATIARDAHGPEQRLHCGHYEELYTVFDHDLDPHPRIPTNTNTAYILTVFKTINSDLHSMEMRWASWSGADYVMAHAPQDIGLRRLSFFRRLGKNGTFTYILLCECSHALAYMARTMEFVENIRTRKCGYTGIYTVNHSF